MLDFYSASSLKQQLTGSDVGLSTLKIQHLNLSIVVAVRYHYKNPTSEPVNCCFSELAL
jgi:hypothetical protein